MCRRMSEAQFWSTYFHLIAHLLERPLPRTVPPAPALTPSSAAEHIPEQCESRAWSQWPSPSTMSAWEDLGGGSMGGASGEHKAASGPPRAEDDLDEYLKVRSIGCTTISCCKERRDHAAPSSCAEPKAMRSGHVFCGQPRAWLQSLHLDTVCHRTACCVQLRCYALVAPCMVWMVAKGPESYCLV